MSEPSFSCYSCPDAPWSSGITTNSAMAKEVFTVFGTVALALVSLSLALALLSVVTVAGSLALAVSFLLALAPFLAQWLLLLCLCRWLSCSGCVVSAGSDSDFGSVALALVISYSPWLSLLLCSFCRWLSCSGCVVSVSGSCSIFGSVALAGS